MYSVHLVGVGIWACAKKNTVGKMGTVPHSKANGLVDRAEFGGGTKSRRVLRERERASEMGEQSVAVQSNSATRALAAQRMFKNVRLGKVACNNVNAALANCLQLLEQS